jgi:hypothetical protein
VTGFSAQPLTALFVGAVGQPRQIQAEAVAIFETRG